MSFFRKISTAVSASLLGWATCPPVMADSGNGTNYSVGTVGLPVPPSATYAGMLLNGGALAGISGTTWGTAPTGLNVLGVNADVLSLPSLPAGGNTIGAISNTAFGISGTLPAFAATPTVNVGTFPALSAGAATIGAVNQAGSPWGVNLSQMGGSSLGAGTAWGSAPSGGTIVQNMNANIVAGTVSATFSGYSPTAYGAPLSVTNTTARQALPGGTTVVVYNVGSNNAYVTLGNSSVTATTSNDVVFPNCWITYAVGSATNIAAITSSSTTTLNLSGGSGLPAGGCAAVLTGASTVTANQGTATGGTAWPVSLASLPALAAGGNTIGAISNTAFGVSGTLPAFAATPTFNLGTLNGAATAVNQEVTVAGTSATSAQGMQGVTGGIAVTISGTVTANAGTNLNTSALATASNQEVTAAGTSALSGQGVQGLTGGVPMPVSAAALPLPSGASTSANQTSVQSSVGTSAATAITVQGSVTGVAQPVSAASLPLPTGAATSALQTTGNTALTTINTTLNAPMQNSGGSVTANAGTNLNTSLLATAANQEVTAAGTSAASAQGVQGVTGGIAVPTAYGPNQASITGNITVLDSGTTCTATAGLQTQCTGTPTANSFVSGQIKGAGCIGVSSALSGGTATATMSTEISLDNVNWYGRGLFLDGKNAPIWVNNITGGVFGGETPGGGVLYYRVRSSAFTVLTGTPTFAITIIPQQAACVGYVGNLPTAGNGSQSVASVNIQGGGASALNVGINAIQQAGVTLAAPTAAGTSTTGNIPAFQGVSGGVPIAISGSVTASFAQFAPNSNYSTPLVVGPTSARTTVPSGGGTTIAVYNAGTTAAFVQLGNSSVSATSADDQVAPGGFLCFGVGSNTNIAAIETAGTTTLNISGGSGGCAGSGGGGGSSSGGAADANISGPTGTISAANNFSTGLQVSNWQNGRVSLTGTATSGSILSWSGFSGWNSGILECTGAGTQGVNQFEVDISGPTGGTLVRRVATFTGPSASIPVNIAGQTFLNVVADVWSSGAPTCLLRGSINQSIPDDYAVPIQADLSAPISFNTAATVQLLAPVAGQAVYVTSFNFMANGTTNVTLEAGTQTTNPCDTSIVLLTGAYPLTAQQGMALGSGNGLTLNVPPGDQLCAINSAGVQVSGALSYTRR